MFVCDFHFFFRFCVLFIPLSVHISFLWIKLRWYICRLNICIFFGLNANTDLVLVFGFFLVLSVHDTHQLLALLCVCVRQIEQQAILMLLFIQPFFFFFLFFHFFSTLHLSISCILLALESQFHRRQIYFNRFSLHFYHIIPSFSSLLLSSQIKRYFFN